MPPEIVKIKYKIYSNIWTMVCEIMSTISRQNEKLVWRLENKIINTVIL